MSQKVLVAGPPCGGKSSFARQYAPKGASILDFDDLRTELGYDRYSSGQEGMKQAYELWLERLPVSDWVVWSAPRRQDRGRFRSEYGARSVVVLASLGECLRRAALERPAMWQGRIRSWFALYEPSTSSQEIVVRSDSWTAREERWA